MVVREADFARWAAYGAVAGLAIGALQLQNSWDGDGVRVNLIELVSMGFGCAFWGIVVAAIWNRAGKV
jgi:hypothetical protein